MSNTYIPNDTSRVALCVMDDNGFDVLAIGIYGDLVAQIRLGDYSHIEGELLVVPCFSLSLDS